MGASFLKYLNGHIRQLVDSLPYKEEVGGSSPSMPTNYLKSFAES